MQPLKRPATPGGESANTNPMAGEVPQAADNEGEETPMTSNEDWRAVPGWEGDYSVSSGGRVRSEERRDRRGDLSPQRVLTPFRHNGRPTVLLWRGWHLTVAAVGELYEATWAEVAA